MATFLHTSPSSLLFKTPKTNHKTQTPLRHCSISPPLKYPFLSFCNSPRFSSIRVYSTPDPDPLGQTPSTSSDSAPPESDESPLQSDVSPVSITDEWGEKVEPEPEPDNSTRLLGSDPPKDEDEWGGDEEGVGYVESGNGSAHAVPPGRVEEDKVRELKRGLVDTVYGSNFGFGASSEVRAEVLELVIQLEAANPTPAPIEATGLLNGNWVLVYTASSELLPLLVAGTLPLVKVEKIYQDIDTSTATIVNSITLSSPVATVSFSASATFEVRSASRIQVEFKEGTLKPPEIQPTIELPQNLQIFGQSINLSPLQQSLTPLQDVVASISRTISGQPPLKLPIPGERTKSWLIITYLDDDFRIARGDGGLFVLAREGSPLLDQ